MAIDAGEYKSRVGLDKLYYALVTTDSLSAYTAGTPKYLAPAASATQAPVVNSETQYADDGPFDVMTTEGATTLTLGVTGIPLETLAEISGKVFDSVNGRMYETNEVAPYCALGFRSLKSNGSYRYYWFLKGRFTMPNEDAETKGESPNPQAQELTFEAIQSTFKFDTGNPPAKTVKRVVGDDDVANFDPTNWFTAVQTPATGSSI